MVKNKGLIAEAYEWDEEEVSSDDNEMVEVKVPMALAEENDAVSKEGARNGECVKISLRKRISEQIPSQKKRILGVDQLTEDPSSSGLKDLVFVKSLASDTKVTIPGVERPWFFKVDGFILPNHDTSRILPSKSQRNINDYLVAVTDSSVTDYDLTDESSVCSIPLPPLKKLDGDEPITGPKTIKSILRLKSTFKTKALKDVTINEPSLAPAKGNKSSLALKVYSAPTAQNTTILNPPLPVPPMVTLAPQDRWSQDKHIELVNIISNPRAGMLTRAIAKQLSAASAHECLFVDFLSKEEPKKVSEALRHPGWVNAMQDELNQFARNKVWTLVPVPYGKTIVGSIWVFRNKRDETGIVIKTRQGL
nr:retrovirus-related Pol polyprotein from transposon TNT 1-94 [Tanacetum cinerariifolium]